VKILITGTSGTGKSTVAAVLREQGFDAIETDYDQRIAYWENKSSGHPEVMPSPYPQDWYSTHDWKWDVGVLRDVLAMSPRITFVCDDSLNKAEAFTLFDRLVVLKVDDDTLTARLQSRTNNPFGKSRDELQWVLDQSAAIVQELALAGATVINASRPIDQVVDDILSATAV